MKGIALKVTYNDGGADGSLFGFRGTCSNQNMLVNVRERRMWLETDVRLACDGVKRLRHPVLGDIALEFSALTVDGRPDLAMQVYTPTCERDAKRIRGLARRH